LKHKDKNFVGSTLASMLDNKIKRVIKIAFV